jgi:hypothetical protein
MSRKKTLIDKKIKKKIDRKCCFCGDDNYSVLDVHRITPGEQNGKYSEYNTIVCCCKCHRKLHAQQIQILGKRLCSNGSYVLQIVENNEEKFIQL